MIAGTSPTTTCNNDDKVKVSTSTGTCNQHQVQMSAPIVAPVSVLPCDVEKKKYKDVSTNADASFPSVIFTVTSSTSTSTTASSSSSSPTPTSTLTSTTTSSSASTSTNTNISPCPTSSTIASTPTSDKGTCKDTVTTRSVVTCSPIDNDSPNKRPNLPNLELDKETTNHDNDNDYKSNDNNDIDNDDAIDPQITFSNSLLRSYSLDSNISYDNSSSVTGASSNMLVGTDADTDSSTHMHDFDYNSNNDTTGNNDNHNNNHNNNNNNNIMIHIDDDLSVSTTTTSSTHSTHSSIYIGASASMDDCLSMSTSKGSSDNNDNDLIVDANGHIRLEGEMKISGSNLDNDNEEKVEYVNTHAKNSPIITTTTTQNKYEDESQNGTNYDNIIINSKLTTTKSGEQQQQQQQQQQHQGEKNDHELHFNHERLFDNGSDGMSTSSMSRSRSSTCSSLNSVSTGTSTSTSMNTSINTSISTINHYINNRHNDNDDDFDNESLKSCTSSRSNTTLGSNATILTSFTYGDQSCITLSKPVKKMFSGTFSIDGMDTGSMDLSSNVDSCMDQMSMSQYSLDLDGNDGDNSCLSSHFGDHDSFFHTIDDERECEYGSEQDSGGNSVGSKQDSSQCHNRTNSRRSSIDKPTAVVIQHQQHGHPPNKQQQDIENNTSFETEYLSLEDQHESYSSQHEHHTEAYPLQEYSTQQKQQEMKLPKIENSSGIATTPEQHIKQSEDQSTLQSIILNTAEKDKDEKQRQVLLDVISQNVIVAEKNAKMMVEAVHALYYNIAQKRNRSDSTIMSPLEGHNYSAVPALTSTPVLLQMSRKSFDDYHQYQEQLQEDHKDKMSQANLSSFVKLPKTNLLLSFQDSKLKQTYNKDIIHPDNEKWVDSIDDSSLSPPDTKRFAFKQERFITNLVEPGCQNMKQSIAAYNWCFNSPLDKTPKKSNTISYQGNDDDNEMEKQRFMETVYKRGSYECEPSTEVLSHEKENILRTKAHCYSPMRHEQPAVHMDANLNFDFMRLVSPIHKKRAKQRVKEQNKTPIRHKILQLVYQFLGFIIFFGISLIVFCICNQEYSNIDLISTMPPGFRKSILENRMIHTTSSMMTNLIKLLGREES